MTKEKRAEYIADESGKLRSRMIIGDLRGQSIGTEKGLGGPIVDLQGGPF
jgi:hypothetical protein